MDKAMACAVSVAKTVEEVKREMVVAKELGADLFEIRLDYLGSLKPRFDLRFLLENRPLPVVATFRPKWEGGQYEGDDTKRFEALQLAMELGAEFVDIELQVAEEFLDFISDKRRENTKLIVSSHNYKYTPSSEEIGSLVARIQAVGADIVKIVTFAVDICDVVRMFQVLVNCQIPMIGLCMGERGVISRLLCPKFGGYLTFGTLSEGKESAPGQPTMSDLLNVYRVKQLGVDTKIYGIIGKPVGQSKSPKLHNAVFKAVGLDAVYVPFLTKYFCNKTSAIWLGGSNNRQIEIANFFNCTTASFPINYLGIPLRWSKLHKEGWLPMIDKVELRLNTWAGR